MREDARDETNVVRQTRECGGCGRIEVTLVRGEEEQCQRFVGRICVGFESHLGPPAKSATRSVRLATGTEAPAAHSPTSSRCTAMAAARLLPSSHLPLSAHPFAHPTLSLSLLRHLASGSAPIQKFDKLALEPTNSSESKNRLHSQIRPTRPKHRNRSRREIEKPMESKSNRKRTANIVTSALSSSFVRSPFLTTANQSQRLPLILCRHSCLCTRPSLVSISPRTRRSDSIRSI
jgi:hypothetical protein